MNAFDIIKLIAILLAIIVVYWFFRHYQREELSMSAQLKIIFIGFISNLLDTVGIGSFAVITFF